MSSFLPLDKMGWGNIKETYEVPVHTVDCFVDEQGLGIVDVLKSDTQGFDLEVLKGAQGSLKKGIIKLVYLEINFSSMYQGQPNLSEIFDFMLAHDFELMSLYPIHYIGKRAGWTDGLFIQKDIHPAQKPAF